MNNVLNKKIFKLSIKQLERRIFGIIPATLSWGTLIGLTVMAFVLPYWVSIFIIIYDLHVLIRAAYMSVHLVYAYRRLNLEKTVDWISRCQGVNGNLVEYREEIKLNLKKSDNKIEIRQLKNHLKEINQFIKDKRDIYDWEKIQHVVILPTYNESMEVLRTSLDALVDIDYPHEKVHVVIGFEDRVGDIARERAAQLLSEYSGKFKTLIAAFHPDGLPNESRVKSANATWAIKKMEKELKEQGISVKDVLISNFDSDTVVSRGYFSNLAYTFSTAIDRYHASYQPLPMYHNNIWDAPAFSRVIATGSTFWQMIESTRPERLVTFSSHAMTLQALKDVNYWHTNIVSEDSRIFWQCLLHYNGNYRTIPLYSTVSMDAALDDSWWKTVVNQYKQKRRWAWGIENFPYLAAGFKSNKKIKLSTKFTYLYRTLEGHYSWATAPIIIAVLGWLPIFFGGPEFHATVLSYSLPYMTRTIMSIAMSGLIISTVITLLLLPKRPRDRGRWHYVTMVIQWALVPIIATTLSAVPALDAETRLLLGQDLGFYVTSKTRKRKK